MQEVTKGSILKIVAHFLKPASYSYGLVLATTRVVILGCDAGVSNPIFEMLDLPQNKSSGAFRRACARCSFFTTASRKRQPGQLDPPFPWHGCIRSIDNGFISSY
jgi:hypothetical protein